MRNRDRSRKTGGILIYVEIIVEMRNSAPFVRNQRVRNHVLAKILLVQLKVSLAERVRGERGPGFGHGICLTLKFLEHRLTDQRTLETLQIMINQIRPLHVGRGFPEQIFQQQNFIGRRSDLRHKNFIMRIQECLLMR